MKKTIQITIALLFSSLTLLGQTKESKRADTYFNNLSYISAAKEYKKLAKENPTEHVLKRLGDSYYFNAIMQEASSAYAELFKKHPVQTPEYIFKYAQTLRSIGKFKDSKQWMEKFHSAKKQDARGVNFTSKEAVLSEIKDNKPYYTVTNLKGVNTEFSDFGVTEYNNTIIFSSPQKLNRFVKRTHTKDETRFLDLFQVAINKIDSSANVASFSDEINKKFHESSVAFSPDQKTIYFTRNNFNNGVYKKDKNGINKLKIYKAELVEGKWKNIRELPFCSDEYSVGHPSVSKDGKRLYFVSDMPGSIGGTDIYYTEIKEDGSFGYIQNLGIAINTEGKEMFPFISDDDILYFSSDGHFGIGALDVFASKKDDKGFYTTPINLKAPINSKLDDFAFSMNPITKKGFLSSNREGGVGSDDIYSIAQIKELELTKPPCMQIVLGVVRDKNSQKPLSGARVVLKDSEGMILKDTLVGVLGQFNITLPCNKSYSVVATKEYYQQDALVFVTTEASNLNLNLNLEMSNDFTYNERGELIIRINPIYFDYNKSNIRIDASTQLDHIVRIMNKYPKLVIRSSSHTDARGKDTYNEALSDKRAKSTVEYIISKGINPIRITGKGFGERQLTNNCVDNNKHTNRVKCTKDQHQENRRTEFVVIKK
ncbi:OmpA family protein [Polaribacter sp. MSW13]|uniref:OmpA family protein n=1 Tax=Polaribacter marinus TaxID=2916838 RepID=A0A9X2AJS0_9FLAO|nr:OmpA family protein [Polaribacter marinus]MCI2229317.1 OmpA family protein [Polaribacter marinus]